MIQCLRITSPCQHTNGNKSIDSGEFYCILFQCLGELDHRHVTPFSLLWLRQGLTSWLTFSGVFRTKNDLTAEFILAEEGVCSREDTNLDRVRTGVADFGTILVTDVIFLPVKLQVF